MSKSTGIRSKITGIRFGFTENLNFFRKSRSRLRNHVKTRQKNYHTNVANFSTLDRNFEIRIFSILVRFDLGMMIHLGKILVRILPWDPWLPRCSKNLARSCQDSQDASKRVNRGVRIFSGKPNFAKISSTFFLL